MDSRRFNRPEGAFSYRPHLVDKDEESKADKRGSRPKTFYRTEVLSRARGSSYVELGAAKVVCAVYGPRDIPRRSDFSMRGVLFCHFARADFALPDDGGGARRRGAGGAAAAAAAASPEEKDLGLALQDALAGTVQMECFPKSQIDVFVYVLEEEPGEPVLSACLTAAGLALVSGGLPMLDVLVGGSSKRVAKSDDGGGAAAALNVGYLPSLEQLQSVQFEGGLLSAEAAAGEIERLVEDCKRAEAGVKACLLSEIGLEQ